jgi:xylulokinase
VSIGTSAIGSCVLPIDEQGQALRPGILYGIDSRASFEIEYLEGLLGRDEIFRRTGMHLTSQASGPKVLWIRNNEPEVFARARWFLTSQAYLVYKLTGQASIDIYTASGYAPLFDVNKREWIQEVADCIVSPDRLPPVFWSSDVVGSVSTEAARETGLADGTPVICGTTDAAAEAISAGVTEFGDLMLMLGSSIFFIMKAAEYIKTQKFWAANFLEDGAAAFAGGMSTSGSLTTWFRDQFAQLEVQTEKEGQENAFAILADMAAQSPAGSNGLIALPYFEGERTPIHDPKARGVLFGLSLAHTRGDIYRSILEGVAFGIRHNLEAMKEEGVHPRRILPVGGGIKNSLWLQIIADVCNIDLAVPEQQYGASYGDAFMAATGVGLFSNLSEIKQWVRMKEIIKPNPDNQSVYDRNYQIFRDLYTQTKTLMHKLTDK